jgi:hypothetical protein
MKGGAVLIKNDKIFLTLIVIISYYVLSACLRQETPTEKIFKILEKVAVTEKEYEYVQDPLGEIEKKEKSTYDKIINLYQEQYDEKVSLSNEALTLANERKKYMEIETESLQKSEAEFKKMDHLKNSLPDKKLKKQADELYHLMIKRYKAHERLTKNYLSGILEDQQLYDMLQRNSVPIEKLMAQIEKINLVYKKIYHSNDQFNLFTKQYNNEKILFYKSAGLIKD